MALEQDIQELTAAVKALTAALGKSQPAVATKAEKPVSDTPAKAEPVADTASSQAGATPPSTGETAAPEASKSSIEFKDLVAVATELNKKDWKKLGAICEREKVSRISGLAEGRWAPVHDEIVAILEGLV